MSKHSVSLLSDILETPIAGMRPSGGVDSESDGIPSLGGENILKEGGTTIADVKRIPPAFFRAMPRGHLKRFDVLINKDGAQTGKVGIYEGEFSEAAINEHLFILRSKNGQVEQRYLYYALLAAETQIKIARYIGGSAQPGLNSQFTKKVSIPLPLPDEQRRIAEVLSTVDGLIEKTEALIAKQEAVKTGFAQDLFSSVRTTETIDTIAEYVGSGITPTGGSEIYGKEGVVFLRSQNVLFSGLSLDDVAYISASIHSAMKRSAVFENDVLLNITGASIGRSCVVPRGLGEANVNQHVCAIRIKNRTIEDALYLSTFLNSAFGQHQIWRLNAGGNREGLNYRQVRAIRIPWPKGPERIIAAIRFGSASKSIDSANLALQKLRVLKSGLMQDLLSGKVQVAA